MPEPRGGRVDLLAASRGERHPGVREERPEGPDWRADALGPSRHSRLEAPRPPAGGTGEAQAAALCAELCRQALGDFAPALLLLSGSERRRVQALAAYAFTLFDFARQRGIEGERLAQINRWEFSLEEAVAAGEEAEGAPARQPIFERMAAQHRARPWPPAALAALGAAARERVAAQGADSAAEVEARERRLARALGHCALGAEPPPRLVELGAVLLALAPLQDLGEELRQHRWPAGAGDSPRALLGEPPAAEDLLAALPAAVARLRGRLAALGEGPPASASGWRRAARYLELAAAGLLDRIEAAGAGLLDRPARLGLAARLARLAFARWGA